MLGYSSDEYVGHNISEFHVDKHVIEDILARLCAQRDGNQLRSKDAAERRVRSSCSDQCKYAMERGKIGVLAIH
jgi:hypothetical protein